MTDFKIGDRVKHAEGDEKTYWFRSRNPEGEGTVVGFIEGLPYPLLVTWDGIENGDNYPHQESEVVPA